MPGWPKEKKFGRGDVGVITVEVLVGSGDGSFLPKSMKPVGFEGELAVVQGASRPVRSAEVAGRTDPILTLITGPVVPREVDPGIVVVGRMDAQRTGCVRSDDFREQTKPVATLVVVNTKR